MQYLGYTCTKILTCLFFNLGNSKKHEKENNSYARCQYLKLFEICGLFPCILQSWHNISCADFLFVWFNTRLTLPVTNPLLHWALPSSITSFFLAEEVSGLQCAYLHNTLSTHLQLISQVVLKLFQVIHMYNHGALKVWTFNISWRLFSKALVDAVKASSQDPMSNPSEVSSTPQAYAPTRGWKANTQTLLLPEPRALNSTEDHWSVKYKIYEICETVPCFAR